VASSVDRATDGNAGSTATSWEITGPLDAPPVVFLHGAILSRAMWAPQVERLADRYRCITLDLAGHGVLAGRPYELEAAAEAVIRVIDEAAGGRAVVVGLSLGGYTGMAAAAAAPDRVRGLVVAGASFEPLGIARLGYLWYGWALRLLPARLLREVGIGLFRRVYGRTVGDAVTQGYDARAGGLAIQRLAGQRFRDRLRAYGGPVLVLNGDRDPWFVLGERGFVTGLPNVTVRRLAGASHVSNLDRADEFAAAIASFEAGLPA
jgi:pimeloyl-ACP methyl ester carboxylesterase